MKTKQQNRFLALIALAATACPASAAFTPITTVTTTTVIGTNDQILLQDLTADSKVYPVGALRTGTSSVTPANANIARMDDFDLNNILSGLNGSTSLRTVAFGGANFTDSNGTNPDFFLFEAGGDPDDITIAAVLPGGTLGAAVTVPGTISAAGWGNTGKVVTANATANAGQPITGICWDITDLKDASGAALAPGSTVEGIAILSGFGIDPGGLYSAAPPAGFDRLAVSAPATQAVDTAFDITITAQDAGGITVNDSTTTVSIAGVGTNPAGSLMEFDWNADTVYGDSSGTLVNGVRVIKARNKKAQTVTLTASAGSTSTPLPPNVVTTAGAYTQLQILAPGETADPGTATGKTGVPSVRIFNTPFNATVNAVDSNWNPVPSATADPVIAITSNDSSAILPVDNAISANASLYSVTFNTAPGPFTVTATDTASPAITATTPPLTVYGPAITWLGDGLTNEWDTVTPNWTGASTFYAEPSQVTFNNTGSTSPAINIAATVSPSTIVVSNSTVDYEFQGPGSIAGTIGGFTKSGGGALRISTVNSYTGPTTVSGGLLIPMVADALPSTSALRLSGGRIGLQGLNFTRAPGTGVGQVNLENNGGFAAFGADQAVNFGGAEPPALVTMGTVGFFELVTSNTFALSHVTSDATLEIRNPIALRNGLNFFQVADGSAEVDVKLSGVISSPLGGVGFSKSGDGTLMFTNPGNSFNTGFIDSGTIMLGADNVIPGGTLSVQTAGGAAVEGTLDINGFSDVIGALTLGTTGSQTQNCQVINSSLVNPNTILTLGGTLTYNATATQPGQATISANLATVATTGDRSINVADGEAGEDLVISGNLTGDSITKIGVGTLVVSKPRYSGNTTVGAGTIILGLANPNNDSSTVTVAAGATLNLNYTGTDIVRSLVIGTTPLADGVYGPSATPAIGISGTGTITVLSDPYLAWAGAGVPFDGDANNDGVQNGLAWLLGATNKDISALDILPRIMICDLGRTGNSMLTGF